MNRSRFGSSFTVLLGLVCIWTASAAVYLAARSHLLEGRPTLLLLIAGALILTLVVLFAWWRQQVRADLERRRVRSEVEPLKEKAREAQRYESERDAAQEKVSALEKNLEQKHAEVDGLKRIAEIERDWTRRLRYQVQKLHAERGPLGSAEDLPEKVLEVAMNLVRADKGILLRKERDSDELAPAASRGFVNDPSESHVARRFAKKVIAQEEIVRENDPEVENGATGADREIDNLIAIPIYVADEFSGAVICANGEGGFDAHDEHVLLALGDHAGAALENGRLHGELRTSYLATVRMLADVIEAKDALLRGHSEEVSRHVFAVAEKLGFETHEREELVFGSLLHDIGKVGISERILMKPGRLSPEEYNVVKLHPRIGFRLIESVPALESIAQGILHHHERWDGDGYPSGLRQEEIPLSARVIAVADSFSAMTADRPYRGRMSVEEACAELERCAGSQFDPQIVKIFVEEVKANPPLERGNALAIALDDPEIDVRRGPDEIVGQSTLAYTDNLTLLYSHRYFHEVLEAEANRAQVQGEGFSIVLIRIEDIGEINETQGYAVGDGALRRCGEVITQAAQECGGTACRYNGRRFAILCPQPDLSVAERIARRVEAELQGYPRASTAVSKWNPGEGPSDVLKRALATLEDRPPVP
jgi:diguanylate cyclase (GGDEF)-like protein